MQYRFPLGPIESDSEAVQRKKKFGLHVDDSDPALRFSAYCLSQDTAKGWLACGAFDDKRVRVVQMASNGPMVFEANTEVNPSQPWGGNWMVHRVEFLADAKYLLAEYDFGGRGTSTVLRPTEIFETATWKIVWKNSDPETGGITLSPDGKRMAFLRGDVLEVHAFDVDVGPTKRAN